MSDPDGGGWCALGWMLMAAIKAEPAEAASKHSVRYRTGSFEREDRYDHGA
jgi:hypothetical protein